MSAEKTAVAAFKDEWTLQGGLRAIGVDPLGSADQVQKLRDCIDELERELGDYRVRSETSEVVDDVLMEELKLDVRRLRDETGRLRDMLRASEETAEAKVVALERQVDELTCQLGAMAHTHSVAVHRRDECQLQLAELKAQHEELKAKCTPPSAVIAFASCTRHSPEAIPVRDFIRSLAPKRQTRADAVADELMRLREAAEKGLGVFMVIDEARMLCDAAGVNADEEKPEAT